VRPGASPCLCFIAAEGARPGGHDVLRIRGPQPPCRTRQVLLRRLPADSSLPLVTPSILHRPRRRRRTETMRRLVREHELRASDLIQPLFVVHGSNIEREIGSMPGVYQRSV